MKKLVASFILSLFTINSAFADSTIKNSKNFAGPAIAIGASSVGTNSKFKYLRNGENSTFSVGENEFIGVAGASYLKDIDEKWLIGGGVTYDLNSLKNKSVHYFNNATGTYDTTIQSKRHLSIYAQPTYALSETTALFLKVSYNQTRIDVSDEYFYSNRINHYKKTLRGVGLGVGTMILLDKNIFTKLEIEYVDYSKVNIPYSPTTINYKLSTTSGTLSIGYRF